MTRARLLLLARSVSSASACDLNAELPQAKVFGILCIYARAVEECCDNRFHSVNRRLVYGTRRQLTEVRCDSVYPAMVNTGLMARVKPTIRQARASLSRRGVGHVRFAENLDDSVCCCYCHLPSAELLATL